MSLAVTWAATAGWIALRAGSAPDVVSAERLDVVEPDSQLAFSLANSERGRPGILDGDTITGDKCVRVPRSFSTTATGRGGGLLFANSDSGDARSATRHLALDGYKQDQTVVLHHYQDTTGSYAGLSLVARPEDVTLRDRREFLGLELGATHWRVECRNLLGREPGVLC